MSTPADKGIRAAKEEARLRRLGKLKLFVIRFKLPGRGNKVFKWERWYKNSSLAKSDARKALKREYPNGYRLTSVKLAS